MSTLERLRGGLIVSVQAAAGSALDDPYVIAAMAAAAVEGGAAGVRIQGVANLQAVRERVGVPIVGLVKREYPGFEPYITPTLREVGEISAAGADVVAFDATARPHPDSVRVVELVAAVHAEGRLAMADCALGEDGAQALAAGADILATTLCGYTVQTKGHPLPALDIVAELRALGSFVVCEGGVHSPESAGAALEAGADAVVVGTAITGTPWLVARFVAQMSFRA